MSKVWILTNLCDDEYGCHEIVGVFSTYEKALEVYNMHLYYWKPWWSKEEIPGLLIKEWEVDTHEEIIEY